MPSPGTEFHKVQIAGITFAAGMAVQGPHLAAHEDGVLLGKVVLGGSPDLTIVRDSPHLRFCGPGWYVVDRDRSRVRIPLVGFSDGDAGRLADEMGITINRRADIHNFYRSAAWAALKKWVEANPSLADICRTYEGSIPGWHARAVKENREAKTDISLLRGYLTRAQPAR